MSNKLIFIFHGMGTHTKETMKTDFIEPIKEYSNFYGIKLKSNWEETVHLIEYDSHFKKVLDDWKKDFNSLKTLLPLGSNAEFTKILLPELKKIDDKLTEENRNFLITHFGDVLLYKYLRDVKSWIINKKSLEILDEIINLLKKVGLDRLKMEIHFVGHSLGTAIAADLIDYFYTKYTKEKNVLAYYPFLDSMHMFGNVSHLIRGNPLEPSKASVYKSFAKPLVGTKTYSSYRHKFDPFTLEPYKFQPDNWPEKFKYSYYNYNLERITLPIIFNENVNNFHNKPYEKIKEKLKDFNGLGNTHSFKHYISDPEILFHLIKSLNIGKDFTINIEDAKDKFKKISLDISDKEELKEIIDTLIKNETKKILKVTSK